MGRNGLCGDSDTAVILAVKLEVVLGLQQIDCQLTESKKQAVKPSCRGTHMPVNGNVTVPLDVFAWTGFSRRCDGVQLSDLN